MKFDDSDKAKVVNHFLMWDPFDKLADRYLGSLREVSVDRSTDLYFLTQWGIIKAILV